MRHLFRIAGLTQLKFYRFQHPDDWSMVREWFTRPDRTAQSVDMVVRILGVVIGVMAFSTLCLGQEVPLPKLRPPLLNAKPLKKPLLNFPPLANGGGWTIAATDAARAHCSIQLQGLDLTFDPLPPLGVAGGCGAAAPVLLRAIGQTRIVPPAEVNCDFAEALHGWVTSSLQPSAKTYLKKDLTVINNASAYVCRRRNGLASGKMSEHGIANAFDIASLQFSDGSTTTIKGDWSGAAQLIGISSKGNFLRRLRRDACIRFTTVLGPGSDRYHGDHFHVDLARRRNGFRICK